MNMSHDPKGPHTIPPNTPITAFFHGMPPDVGKQVLYANLNKVSGTYFPAWNSALFHGVTFPWTSLPPVAIGVRDLQTFGNLIECTVLTYTHFGWHVV
jgi:hypothetical protein